MKRKDLYRKERKLIRKTINYHNRHSWRVAQDGAINFRSRKYLR